jgi:hypothetical protein
MPAVEGCDLADAESLGNSNHCGLEHTQREVCIPAHELGHPPDVSPSDLDEFELFG